MWLVMVCMVGSVSGSAVNAMGVGGGEGGGGSSLTITHEKQKLISKVQVVGACSLRYDEGDYNLVTEIDTTFQINRKTMLDVAGNVRRWWFVIHASENVLLDFEGRWDQLQFQTGWKLEPCMF